MGYFSVELSVDWLWIECKSRRVQFLLLPDRFQVCIKHTLDNNYVGYGEYTKVRDSITWSWLHVQECSTLEKLEMWRYLQTKTQPVHLLAWLCYLSSVLWLSLSAVLWNCWIVMISDKSPLVSSVKFNYRS